MQTRLSRLAPNGLSAAGFAAAMLAAVPIAQAGTATSWNQSKHATVRLVADRAPWGGDDKKLVVGVHIKMDKGWKTYWRNPGAAGLPPRFDWTGSGNLKEARILWPAPVRFHDSAGTSYGYKKEVVFPILIEPENAGEPVDLKLNLEFAVCADICIPAQAAFQLKAGDDGFFSTSYTSLLTRYMERVPVKAGSQPGRGPSVSRAEAKLTGEGPYLTVDAKFPGGADGADLFIEGPEGFYLPPPQPVGDRGGETLRFKVDLTKGDAPADLKGKTLTLTLVSRSEQTETTWRLD